MKTSLLGDIDIIYTTNELIDCYFYEYLMKQILKNYNLSQHSETKVALDRIKPNKEMFDTQEIFLNLKNISGAHQKLNNELFNFLGW